MIDDAVPALLNHLLNQSSWARQRLAPFAGKHVGLSMPPVHARLRIAEEGWFGAAADDAVADVEISLPAETPFLALRGIEKVMEAARIEGAAQFAAELSYVLKHLGWDYEEDLSRVVGDIAAHRVATGLAAFAAWQKRSAERLARDAVSYATEKHALLARRGDQRGFADDLAELRSALERSERRVQALASAVRPR